MNWNSSILWGIIGLVGGFLVSLLFFTLSKKQRKLAYSIYTIPNLGIYESRDINMKSVSDIYIYNIGNDTLEPNDFPELNKLSLTTNGVFPIRSINQVEFKKSNKYMKLLPILISPIKIEISFDYFEPKDMIYCRVMHTGDIKVCGSIKNGKIIDNIYRETRNKENFEKYLPIFSIIFILMSLMLNLCFF